MAVNPYLTMFCPNTEPAPPGESEGLQLSCQGVSKCYGVVRALDDIWLRVRAGEAFGLLGPNGAGKSTLLLLLAGVLKPDAGTISVQGHLDPTRASVRRAIGYVPQTVALYADLTARENLTLFGRLYGLSRAVLRERVLAALELAQLGDRADAKVSTFSGGMQRRLNLAGATVHEPKVLLLDEPTVGVDPQSRAHIFSCIEALKRRGVAILYSTHYLEEAERLCDTISIIDKGRLLATGTREALITAFGGASRIEATMPEAPKNQRLAQHWSQGKLSLLTDRPTEAVYRLLAEQQDVAELGMRRPNLESVFLNLTGRSMRDG